MSRKYDRHIEMLNILSNGQRRTYTSLSYEFSVSVKTIKKDIFELEYFFPIDIYRGRYGGVEFRKGHTINGYIMKRSDLEILSEALLMLQIKKDIPEIKKLLEMMIPRAS